LSDKDQTSDRRDNSVLVALRELRGMEDDRVKREKEEARARAEAERRARVDGEMKLQEQRMRLEIQSRAQHKSPVKAVVGVAVVVALAGGVLIYRMNAENVRRQEEQAAHQRQIEEQARAEKLELQNQIAAITRDMEAKLKMAKTQAEIDKIKADAARATKDAADANTQKAGKPRKKSGGSDTSSPLKPALPHIPGKRDINDDILNGF